MTAIHWILGIGWAAFWIYWFTRAASSKATIERADRRFVSYRFLLLFLILLAVRFSHGRLNHSQHDLVLALVGVALWVLGLALAIWARVYLGKNWGFPMSRQRDAELV